MVTSRAQSHFGSRMQICCCVFGTISSGFVRDTSLLITVVCLPVPTELIERVEGRVLNHMDSSSIFIPPCHLFHGTPFLELICFIASGTLLPGCRTGYIAVLRARLIAPDLVKNFKLRASFKIGCFHKHRVLIHYVHWMLINRRCEWLRHLRENNKVHREFFPV